MRSRRKAQLLIIISKLTSVEDSALVFKLANKLAEKGKEIAFLHIQEACKATTSTEYCDKLAVAGIEIFALKTDAEAQRLTKEMHRSVKLIDYRQCVSLLMDKHDRIVSWTG